jgi:uncharacterized protein YdeI (YjbR/CyaY-like superfamily)
MEAKFFKTQSELRRWLKKNHRVANELWIGFYKKASGKTGVTYAQALDEALCFGWIDGIKKGLDETSYTNRFTPRRPKSIWSKINTSHVERLTKAGLMMAAGLEQVELAKKDGRWARAYGSPKSAEIPKDFLDALNKNKKAKAFFATLDRTNLYSITFRLQNSKKPETRQRWVRTIIERLAKGEKFHV